MDITISKNIPFEEKEEYKCRYSAEQIGLLFFVVHDGVQIHLTLREEGQHLAVSARVDTELGGAEGFFERDFSMEDKTREKQNAVKKAVFLAIAKLSAKPTPWGILTGIRPAKVVRELLERGFTRPEVGRYLKEEYWVSDEKIALCTEVAAYEQKILKDMPQKSCSLYLHIPFCPSRCVYCSFVSNASKKTDAMLPQYIAAMEEEMAYTAKIVKDLGLRLETVYIGGGTPTTLSPALLDKLLQGVYRSFDCSGLKEFTCEAGRPDTITKEKLAVLQEHGITRLSVNPQTMHQVTLDKIMRRHSPEAVAHAFAEARSLGFSNINADLIAGLPDETPDMFAQTLEAVGALEPENITIHTMYVKRASVLRKELEQYGLAAAETVHQMLKTGADFMYRRGYRPYYMYRQRSTLGNLENIGYAKLGFEGLYNIYIMEEVQTILGIGAGATTKMVKDNRIERIFNTKDVRQYIEEIGEIKAKKDELYTYLK